MSQIRYSIETGVGALVTPKLAVVHDPKSANDSVGGRSLRDEVARGVAGRGGRVVTPTRSMMIFEWRGATATAGPASC